MMLEAPISCPFVAFFIHKSASKMAVDDGNAIFTILLPGNNRTTNSLSFSLFVKKVVFAIAIVQASVDTKSNPKVTSVGVSV